MWNIAWPRPQVISYWEPRICQSLVNFESHMQKHGTHVDYSSSLSSHASHQTFSWKSEVKKSPQNTPLRCRDPNYKSVTFNPHIRYHFASDWSDRVPTGQQKPFRSIDLSSRFNILPRWDPLNGMCDVDVDKMNCPGFGNIQWLPPQGKAVGRGRIRWVCWYCAAVCARVR